MKRKERRPAGRISALAFAVLFAVSAAGCGASEEAATTAQKEFVYVPEFQSLESESGYVDQLILAEDTVYYISGEYDEATQSSTNYLCSFKVGETKPEKTPIDIGKDTSISRMFATSEGELKAILFTYLYEDQDGAASAEGEDGAAADDADTQEGGEAAADDAGAAGDDADAAKESADTDAAAEDEQANDGAASAEGEDDADAATEDTGDGESASASSGTVIISSGDGVTTAFASSDASAVGGEEDWQEPVSQKIEFCTLSTDGTVSGITDITDVFGDAQNAYVQNAEMDKDGNLYLSADQSVIVLDKDGKKLFDLKTENWISDMFSTRDGVVMVCYYGAESMEVHPVDFAKKEFGPADTKMLPSQYGNYQFTRGKDSDVLFSADNKLYSYNLGDEAPLELLNWIDCDIDANEMSSFALLDDGRILAVTSSYETDASTGEGTSKTELVYLTKKKGSEVPEKKIVSYGTMSLGYDARKQVISFNKKSQEYRIEVKEYMTEDWQTGLTQMNTDIVSGKCPDIIDLSSGNMKKYVVKGVLEDLYPYMEKDPEIKKEDYLPNVLKAYETDGKLYALADKFYINTVIAKKSEMGDRKTITLDDLIEITKNLPEGAKLYEFATKEYILMNNINMNMDQYVDWSTGECRFNGEDFMKALEFANSFMSEEKYIQENSMAQMDNVDNTAERLHSGMLKMITTSISSVQEYQMMEGMFGEPITFIGYPTSGDNGSFIGNAGSTLGMSAKSKNKEGAWEYIRSNLTKEVQEKVNNNSWGFPIMKSALEKQFERDMTDEYDTMPDGEKVKRAKTSWGYGSFNMDIYAATKEQVDAVKSLIDSVNMLYQYDEEINNIITEETKAYFEGQKTAKDVADIIQSRVQIYVNENR